MPDFAQCVPHGLPCLPCSCPTHWIFKDEELREDFRDCCREFKCLPSMKAATEGEDEEDKAVRKAAEAAAVIAAGGTVIG